MGKFGQNRHSNSVFAVLLLLAGAVFFYSGFNSSIFAVPGQIEEKRYVLKYIDPGLAKAQVEFLLSDQGVIEVNKQKKEMVVRDYQENIEKIDKLISQIDSSDNKPQNTNAPPGDPYPDVIEVKKLSASEVYDVLKEIFEGHINTSRSSRRGNGQVFTDEVKIQVMPDDRSLMVVANAADNRKIREVVETIEKNTKMQARGADKGEVQTKVIYLHNVPSGEAMAVLTSILGKDDSNWNNRRGNKEEKPAIRIDVDVVELRSSNAIHVTGKGGEIEKLFRIIEELDQPPSQVLIEVIILEVSVKNGKSIGFEWKTDRGDVQMKNEYDLSKIMDSSQGFFIQYSNQYIQAVFRAIEDNTNVKVLSSPHALVSNNKKAVIAIGDSIVVNKETLEIPTGNVANPIVRTTHEYVDVGLRLEITPKINDNGFVSLDLVQDVNDIKDSGVQGFPEISKRNLTTTIVCKDKESVVLGGLISRKRSKSMTTIPFLGHLPIIGRLFRKNQSEYKTTELVLFVTPYIIRNQSDLDQVNGRQKDKMKDIKEQFFKN